jgi:hypothetical protein
MSSPQVEKQVYSEKEEKRVYSEKEETDFEIAQYHMNIAMFYSKKHADEYTGEIEYLSLTNEPMEIETVID